MNLTALQSDPAEFRRQIRIDADGTPRAFGAIMDHWQAADFAQLDPAWCGVAGIPTGASDFPRRAYLERPRGHAKTADLATMATWALFASRRKIRGYGAAGDSDQARLLRDAVDTVVRMNPWLQEILDVQAEKIVNRRTGSLLTMLSSDAPTSYGLTPDFVIADELTQWKDAALWHSLFSASAKRAHCLLLVIANAPISETWQFETREKCRTDPLWYFHRLDGPAARWITQERLDEQRRGLPENVFRRLWLNEVTSDLGGDAFARNDIEAACTLSGPMRAGRPGYNWILAADLATRKDTCAAVILGRHVGYRDRMVLGKPKRLTSRQEILADLGLLQQKGPPVEIKTTEGTQRLLLARAQTWTPTAGRKVSLGMVRNWISEMHAQFRLSAVALDPSQAERLAEELQEEGMNVILRDQTGNALQEQALSLFHALQERRIDLYPDPDLIADLKRARALERSYGWRLSWARRSNNGAGTGHGDLGTALSIAVAVSKKFKRRPGPPRVNRPLIRS